MHRSWRYRYWVFMDGEPVHYTEDRDEAVWWAGQCDRYEFRDYGP